MIKHAQGEKINFCENVILNNELQGITRHRK